MHAKLTKVGNSVGFMIPSAVRRAMKFTAGQTVIVEEVEGGFFVRPEKRPSYKLEDLMAQCDLSAPMPKEAIEWDNAPAVGNEVW